MTLITLYRPNGDPIEFDGVKGWRITPESLAFSHQPNSATMDRKNITTSLPFLIEEEVKTGNPSF